MSIGKPEGEEIAAIRVRRGTLALLAWLCALAGGLSLGSAPALACPNEELRTGPSSSLPDCRTYEMVSPLAKNGFYVSAGGSPSGAQGQASFLGDAVVYLANGPFPGSESGSLIGFYLASRGGNAWSTQSLLPPQSYSYSASFTDPMFAAYSPDLSRGVLIDATDSPPLVSGEQEAAPHIANLFLHDNASGANSLLNLAASGLEPPAYEPTFDGASADFATIIFDAPAATTPTAPGGGVDNLYESAGGALGLVSQIPPAGQPSCGLAGPACLPAPHGGRFGVLNAHKSNLGNKLGSGSLVHVISSDGSRIFFSAEGNLYVREDGATTVQVDAPQGGLGPGGGGVFATAAGDGSQVFFYDEASALLTGDTVTGSGTNLYSYDTHTGILTDLTPAPKAEVLGVVDEASEDGSYLYFVARGVLTAEKNSLEQEAQAGTENLYLSHDGAIYFIHTIADPSGEVYSHTIGLIYHKASRITPDGRHLAFFAEDSGSVGSGESLFAELFEYSTDSGQVSRLCDCGGSEFRQQSSEGTNEQLISTFQYSRALSDNGARVFFENYDPKGLSKYDTNAQPDVYEYEQDGVGGCTVASGCLFLVSSGTSEHGSWFLDASANANDIFFTTSQQLVPADTDGAYDLYDARVDGGIASLPRPPECLGAACLNVPSAPIDATPASLTFSGVGNVPGEVTAQITPKAKLTNAQKLAKAVKACRTKRKSQRKTCEAQARKRYAKTANDRPRARRANINRRVGK